jgi:hypothetical protein
MAIVMRPLTIVALPLTLPLLVVSRTYHRAHFDYTDLTGQVAGDPARGGKPGFCVDPGRTIPRARAAEPKMPG